MHTRPAPSCSVHRQAVGRGDRVVQQGDELLERLERDGPGVRPRALGAAGVTAPEFFEPAEAADSAAESFATKETTSETNVGGERACSVGSRSASLARSLGKGAPRAFEEARATCRDDRRLRPGSHPNPLHEGSAVFVAIARI